MAKRNVGGATLHATAKRNAGHNVHRTRLPQDGAAGVFGETNTRLALLFF
jgi:hypothetical protein